jgi:uncharacterized protein YukE
MVFAIPNSSAMDATAMGGGPGTFVAQIATGSPESIEKLVAQRLKQAEQFLSLINQARSATQTLEKAWGGHASETAVKKFTDTLNSFEQIVKVIQVSSDLLTTSSTLIKAAQTGYTTVVNAVNPTVQALASNWYTYAAAVSLSTAVSATLRAFINGIEAMLSALGGGQLMQEVTEVIKIIGDIEKLVGSGSHGNSVPPAGSFTSPQTTGATNQLKTPPQIASATGQQVAGSGQDPNAASTLSQYQQKMSSGIGTQFQTTGQQTTGTQTGMPTGGGVPYTPGQVPVGNGPTIPGQTTNNGQSGQFPNTQIPNVQVPNLQMPTVQTPNTQLPNTGQYPPANFQQTGTGDNSGWTAVNPTNTDTPVVAHPVTPMPTAPTTPSAPATPATPPGDIMVTTTYDGVSTTVTMPVGTQTDVTLVDPTNGSQVHEHIAAGVS